MQCTGGIVESSIQSGLLARWEWSTKENQEPKLIEVNISGLSEYTSDKDDLGLR